MKQFRLTEQQRQEIAEKYFLGKSSVTLSQEYGVSSHTILYTVRKLGGRVRAPSEAQINFFSQEDRELMFKQYTEGASINELAKKYNSGTFTIWNQLKKHGIQRRKTGGVRKYEVNDYFFDQIDTEEKAYFLGFLYADGNVTQDLTVTEMCLQEPDKNMLQKLNDLIQPTRPLGFRKKRREKAQNQWRMTIRSKKICEDLNKWGCTPAKTFTLKFPNFIPSHLMSHFIRGCIDGDGSIFNDNVSLIGAESFITGFKNFAEKHLQIIFSVYPKKSKAIYEARIGGSLKSTKFLDWLYKDATIYLERKFQKYQNILNRKFSPNYRKPLLHEDGSSFTEDERRKRRNLASFNYRQRQKAKMNPSW